MGSLGGCYFLTKTWPQPTACKLRCWDASDQTTNRAETHPAVDRKLKVFLNKLLPDNKHNLRHGPAYHKDKTYLHAQWVGTSLPPGNLHKPHRQPHSSEDRQQNLEELQPCRLLKESVIIESYTKWDRQQRNMSQMKKQYKTEEKQLSVVEIGNLPGKEIREMIIKMIQDLRKRIEASIKNIQKCLITT